jgi:ATP-dependent DNA helicase RecG
MAKKTLVAFDPEKYMEMAIDTMKNSIAEPRSDSKISPKVGAVLIKEDGTVQVASRGELRYGDHAEFTLLERKNRSERLDGSILFATLEPCAPGSRRHPKLGCAERIVNARVQEVWIGIEDPDPDVDRKGIKFLEDNGIKVHMFYPKFQKVIKEINKEFLKQATERAIDRIEKKEVVLSNL